MSLIQLKPDDMRGVEPPIKPIAGCFICGGAVRRWFNDREKLSDVDVFAPSAEHHVNFMKSLPSAEVSSDHANATTYTVDGVLVQCIKKYFPTLQDTIESFDFNVCQFGWCESGIFATAPAIIGVLRGHLAVNKLVKAFATDSLRRAFKYQRKGFSPCLGTIRDLALGLRELTEEEIKTQIEISPKGGKRGIRYD